MGQFVVALALTVRRSTTKAKCESTSAEEKIAALILFNQDTALGTIAGIFLEPFNRFLFILTTWSLGKEFLQSLSVIDPLQFGEQGTVIFDVIFQGFTNEEGLDPLIAASKWTSDIHSREGILDLEINHGVDASSTEGIVTFFTGLTKFTLECTGS